MAVLDKIKNLLPGGATGGAAGASGGSGFNKKAVAVGVVLILSIAVMVVMFALESGMSRSKNAINVVMKNVRDVIPHMKQRGTGDIIITSSLAAHFPTPWLNVLGPSFRSSSIASNCARVNDGLSPVASPKTPSPLMSQV